MINVLFVCLGNICRSPMAEALFRDLVDKENLSDQNSGGFCCDKFMAYWRSSS